MTKTGSGTLTLSGSSSTATGNLIVSGGILAITGTFNNGTGDTDAGVADDTTGMIYVPTGGSLSTELISLGNAGTNRNGSLVIRGGAVTLTTASTAAGLDAGNGGYGAVMLESGSLSLNRLDSVNNGNGTAVVRVDGGTLTASEYLIFRNLNTEFTVTGGQVVHNAASQNIALGFQNAGTTVMTVEGGTVDNTGMSVTFGQSGTNNAGYTGVLNLTGGNLITNRIVNTQRGGSTSTVNFNGGTLTAATNETDFFNGTAGLTTHVYGGGATIDTAGSNVTISEALEAPTGNGLTSLTVSNAGSGYIGAPYVEITGDGTGATGYAVVDLDPANIATFGQVTGVVITNPGIGYTTATVNLLGGGGSGAVIDTPAFAANVSGGLTKQGGGTLTLSGVNTYTGGTTITGGTLALGVNDALASSGAVTINGGSFFDVATFTNTVGQVTLVDGSITGTTGVLTSTADFDLRNGAVSAILAGSVGLNKTTAGTVTLSGANTFTGAVSVTGGTLAFSAADQLGDASATNTLIVNGGTLSYAGIGTATLAATQVLSLGTSGATLDSAFASGGLELTGGITTAAAADLTKTGPGAVTVSGTTDLNGGAVTISGGSLNAGFSASGISGISVDAGGTLNLFDGSTVTVAINALSLADGSALGFDLNAPGTNDVLNLTGSPTVAGTISVNLNDLGGLGVGNYDLINVSAGALNGASWVLGTAPSGFNYTFDPSFNSNQTLRVIANTLDLVYWQGDQDSSWSTNTAGSTNWASDTAGGTDLGALPVDTDTLVFSTTNASGPAINTTLDGDFTADSLQFLSEPSGVTSFTIAQGTSGTLTLSPQSSNNGISVGDNAGAVTISAPVVTGEAQTWEVIGTGANGSSLTISGDVTFNNAVTKTGDGALTLSGANSEDGGLTINGGTLNLGSTTAPGTGTLTLGPGVTIDNSLGGALSLSNTNAQVWNGSFTFTGTDELDLGSGAVTMGNNLVLNAAASTLTVGGDISDGGNSYTLTKDGAGTLVLDGVNTHGGGTTLAAGVLNLGNAAALGSGTFTVGSGTTFDNTSGGAMTLTGSPAQVWQGDFTFTGSHDLNLRTGAVTMEAPVAVNVTAANLTVGGVIDDGVNAFALAKTGAGTLTVTGASTYSGSTHINEGTLVVGAANALPTDTVVRVGSGSTAGTWDMTNFSQTVAGLTAESTSDAVTNEIRIGTGQTLTVNGAVTLGANAVNSSTALDFTGGGSLLVTSGGSPFQVGGATVAANRSAANVDMSGLLNFTADLGAGTFKVGDVAQVNVNNTPTSTLRLATNNTITAGNFDIGEGTASQNTGSPHTLILGSGTNIINSNGIAVGSGKNNNRARSSGEILFDAGDTTGTLQIRGTDGGSTRATLQMGNSTSTAAQSWTSTMDLSGHTVDALIVTLNMARRTAGNGNTTSTLTFDQGTFDVNTLVMAHRLTTGSGNAMATLNIGDSGNGPTPTFIVNNTTTLAVSTSDTDGSLATSVINISGGNVTFGGAVNMANAGAGRTADSTINITGGTVTLGSSNITRTGGAGTENATIRLAGGTLDMNGRNIGTGANAIVFNAESGTLMNLNELNGGTTALTKTTGGLLILEGTNAHTGGSTVQGGTLQLGSGGSTGTLNTVSAITVESGATFAVNRDNLTTQGTDFSSAAITGDGGFEQSGTGTTVLNAANSYSGATTVSAGILQLGDGGVAGSIDNSSGVTVATGATLKTNRDGLLTLSQTITGPGSLEVANAATGITVLSGGNDYAGTTTVTSGTLQVGDGVSGSLTGTGAVSVNGGTLSGSGTLAGSTILGSGAVLAPGVGDTGTSNQQLTFTHAGAGAVTLDSGASFELGLTTSTKIDGAFLLSGSTALDYLNALTSNGTILNDAIYTSNWQSAESTYDSIVLSAGQFELSGTIKVDDNSGTYALGNIFKLLDWQGLVTNTVAGTSGTFTTASDLDLSGISLPSGLVWDTTAFASYGAIVVVPEPARALLLLLGLLGGTLRRRRV